MSRRHARTLLAGVRVDMSAALVAESAEMCVSTGLHAGSTCVLVALLVLCLNVGHLLGLRLTRIGAQALVALEVLLQLRSLSNEPEDVCSRVLPPFALEVSDFRIRCIRVICTSIFCLRVRLRVFTSVQVLNTKYYQSRRADIPAESARRRECARERRTCC